MKKINHSIFLLLVAILPLFAKGVDELKNDISKIYTKGKLDKNLIAIIAQESVPDMKGLQVVIGTIKGSNKPFLLIYNKDIMIVGDIKKREDGTSLFGDFVKKNRAKIKKALLKTKQEERLRKIQNNKKLVKLLNGDYRDLYFSIEGKNPKGKIVYFITDPNCPYCKRYEKSRLPKIIKSSKEVRVVPLFLNIRGHETSAMRSSWLLQKAKESPSVDMLLLMHKASNPKDKSYEEVDKGFAKKRIDEMKKLLSKRLFRGTPTLFDEHGKPIR